MSTTFVSFVTGSDTVSAVGSSGLVAVVTGGVTKHITGANLKTEMQAGLTALPSQTGNSGKFLKTNGSAASWSQLYDTTLPYVPRFGGEIAYEVLAPDAVLNLGSNPRTLILSDPFLNDDFTEDGIGLTDNQRYPPTGSRWLRAGGGNGEWYLGDGTGLFLTGSGGDATMEYFHSFVGAAQCDTQVTMVIPAGTTPYEVGVSLLNVFAQGLVVRLKRGSGSSTDVTVETANSNFQATESTSATANVTISGSKTVLVQSHAGSVTVKINGTTVVTGTCVYCTQHAADFRAGVFTKEGASTATVHFTAFTCQTHEKDFYGGTYPGAEFGDTNIGDEIYGRVVGYHQDSSPGFRVAVNGITFYNAAAGTGQFSWKYDDQWVIDFSLRRMAADGGGVNRLHALARVNHNNADPFFPTVISATGLTNGVIVDDGVKDISWHPDRGIKLYFLGASDDDPDSVRRKSYSIHYRRNG